MPKLLFVILTIATCNLTIIPSFAQYENVWVFGDQAGLDFNSGSPVAIRTAIETGEGTAMVCDHEGQLLFYTDGSTVYNRNHDTMPNGNIFTPEMFLLRGGRSPTSSTCQGAAIVPDPSNRYRYYVFSLQHRTSGLNTGRLSYSVVDMTLNSGLGDVIVSEKDVYMDTLLTEQMTVIPGVNCDAWLMVSEFSDKDISWGSLPAERHYRVKAYHIDENGVALSPIITDSLPSHPWRLSLRDSTVVFPGDHMVISFTVSNDHSKLVDNMGALTFYDFDRSSGRVANAFVLSPNMRWTKSCFSPDDTKLYAIPSMDSIIYQFKVISHSPLIVDPTPVVLGSEVGGIVTHLKLGPDKRIYFTHDSSGHFQARYIGIIHDPNQVGQNSRIEEFALRLYDSSWMDPWPFQYHFQTFAKSSLPNSPIQIPQIIDTIVFRHYTYLHCSDSQVLIPSAIDGWKYRWDNDSTSLVREINTVGNYAVSYHPDHGYCSLYIDSFFVSEVLSCFNGTTGWAYVNKHPSDPYDYSYIWMDASYDIISYADTLTGVPAGKYFVRVNSPEETILVCFEIEAASETVSFDPSTLIACQGDTLDFFNTSSSYYTTFKWQVNQDSLSNVQHLMHAFRESGSYVVQLIGRGKVCIDTFFKTIVVDSQFSAAFYFEPDEVCVGQPVRFSSLLDSSAIGLEWVFSEVVSRVERAIESHYQHSFDRPGRLPITMHAQFRACPDTSYTDSITVYPLPEVDLGNDDAICLHGSPVYLKNVREAPLNPHHYLWSTGDTTAVLKVAHPGIYTLSVTTEPIGCTTTESIEITKDCYIDIPNAFTPNGDGHNDYFLPRQLLSESVDRFHMQVFNRWGQLIFETENIDGRGWDGRFNGTEQPMGVYLYRIKADFTNGRQESYEGNVTLVR